MYVCMYVYTHAQRYIYIYMYNDRHLYLLRYIYTYVHTDVHTYIGIRTYIRTQRPRITRVEFGLCDGFGFYFAAFSVFLASGLGLEGLKFICSPRNLSRK